MGEPRPDIGDMQSITQEALDTNAIVQQMRPHLEALGMDLKAAYPLVEAVVTVLSERMNVRHALDYQFQYGEMNKPLPPIPGRTDFGPWRALKCGLVWLEERLPYSVLFSNSLVVQFYYDPDTDEKGAHESVKLQEPEPRTARILLGRQVLEKLIPLELKLNSDDEGAPSMRFLIQMGVRTYPSSKPLLRLEYAIFWQSGEREAGRD